MRRLVGMCVLGALIGPAVAQAQTPQAPPQRQQTAGAATASDEEIRPGLTTAAGDTGIWFVPTARVLPHKKWSFSLYRTNFDDGQGFTDISQFPITFAVGLKNKAEFFGNWALVTRIDRDTRPLFFTSTADEENTGTGGGIVPNHPLVRDGWSGNKLGDLWLGGKLSIFQTSAADPVSLAARVQLKLPVGDEASGASSGKTDFILDGVVSGPAGIAEVSGYGGLIWRGNPSGYTLTNGFRWGFGAVFPATSAMGLRVNAELFGESYFDSALTAPAGEVGVDGSPVPLLSHARSPVILKVGLTYQAPNGFFVGAGIGRNLNMAGRSEATPGCPPGFLCIDPFTDLGGDKNGFQFRVGFHPGARRRAVSLFGTPPPPPPPPPAPPKPEPPPPPAPKPNQPPTVTAACDPCTVEVGRTATVTATAQDPDGDALTYQWTAAAGSLSNATTRQTPWTAPMQEGPVAFTVTVSDGRGGTAKATTTINVVRPVVKEITFEDVHFDFDRYTLLDAALKVLDGAVTAMQANPNLRLTIEGHTCNIGTAEYNLALGERRANAVRDYLTSRGIAASRLTTVSYGEERPKHDNSREETRRLNRRAALVVRLQ